MLAVGVRVLANGAWGFQSSAVWTADEAIRLARDAVAQANATAVDVSRPVELGPPPPAARGEWVMPVRYDPFEVALTEKMDFLTYAFATVRNYAAGLGAFGGLSCTRQRKVFASTDGSAWSQTTYRTGGTFGVSYHDDYVQQLPPARVEADFLSPAGKGWEHISESGLLDQIPRLVDDAEQARHRVRGEIGRYDMVFSAAAMASLINNTLGPATELDRAVGDEADAEGTSYLDAPLDMLGVHRIGIPAINIVGNRSVPGGTATVRWDDDGVAPADFAIVKDGILVDYQTTREQAAWLAPYYAKANRPVQSHGCANAESAMVETMQHAPNLQLLPASADTSFAQLVATIPQGVAVLSMEPQMDHQLLNGVGYGAMRKIVNGKLGPYIDGTAIQFRSPDLWKKLTALGGAKETRWFGMERGKGQPVQRTTHSVGAVPARIDTVDVIDVMREVGAHV